MKTGVKDKKRASISSEGDQKSDRYGSERFSSDTESEDEEESSYEDGGNRKRRRHYDQEDDDDYIRGIMTDLKEEWEIKDDLRYCLKTEKEKIESECAD